MTTDDTGSEGWVLQPTHPQYQLADRLERDGVLTPRAAQIARLFAGAPESACRVLTMRNGDVRVIWRGKWMSAERFNVAVLSDSLNAGEHGRGQSLWQRLLNAPTIPAPRPSFISPFPQAARDGGAYPTLPRLPAITTPLPRPAHPLTAQDVALASMQGAALPADHASTTTALDPTGLEDQQRWWHGPLDMLTGCAASVLVAWVVAALLIALLIALFSYVTTGH